MSLHLNPEKKGRPAIRSVGPSPSHSPRTVSSLPLFLYRVTHPQPVVATFTAHKCDVHLHWRKFVLLFSALRLRSNRRVYQSWSHGHPSPVHTPPLSASINNLDDLRPSPSPSIPVRRSSDSWGIPKVSSDSPARWDLSPEPSSTSGTQRYKETDPVRPPFMMTGNVPTYDIMSNI
jgi:hypothetical protein